MTLLRHLREALTRPSRIAVLAVTPWPEDRECLRQVASRTGWEVVSAASSEEALAILKKRPIPVILCDRDLPGIGWRDTLAKFLEPAAARCVVLISAVNDEYLLREVVHLGGYDVILKPLQEDRVVSAIQLAWNFWYLGRN